jgi:hypothetical protein
MAVITNLVKNPSFEVNITDWSYTYGGGVTCTRDATVSKYGGASLKCVGTEGADGGLTQLGINLTAGLYAISGWIKTGADTIYNAHMVFRGDSQVFEKHVAVANQDWTRFAEIVNITNAREYEWLLGLGSYGAASPGIVWFDGLMVTPIHLVDFFDGSFADELGVVYDWSGTAHASESTRTIPLLETLSDNFNDNSIDTEKWSAFLGAPAETNYQLELESTALESSYEGYSTIKRYDLRGSYAYTEVKDAGNQSLTTWQAIPVLIRSGDNALSFIITGGNLLAQKQVDGSYSSVRNNVSYNSAVHKFFRIREASGTIYWDYSTDGTTWTNYTSDTSYFDVGMIEVQLLCGSYDSEVSSSKGILDNFNIITENPVASSHVMPTFGSIGMVG